MGSGRSQRVKINENIVSAVTLYRGGREVSLAVEIGPPDTVMDLSRART
jgi:hypothetical protein